jgi:transcriptional regulator with XRE-family HTH domain
MTVQATEGPAMSEQPRALADLRRAAGLSQLQVAQRMGVGKGRVGHIEARYPNVNYGTLTRYISAVGGSIQFVVGTTRVAADQLGIDPDKRGTHHYLQQRPGMGNLVYQPSRAAEELPLQGDAAQPGGDDTGGQVDETHTQGDEGDSDQGQHV